MLNLSFATRIGLFGGTFNPLHNAHLLVAQEALRQLSLSKIVFIPSGIPPHKQVECGISKETRYEMVREAIAPYHKFSISRAEIDRRGPTYTIDTIRIMKQARPQSLCFVVGADLLAQIDTWKEPEALLSIVPFVVAPRDDVNREVFSRPPFDRAEIRFLEMEEIDLSSTWIRERVLHGESITECVPPSVATYIRDYGLYQNRKLAKLYEKGLHNSP